jgi:ATP-dependent DNA helicase DinG
VRQLDSLIEPDFEKYAFWFSCLDVQLENYPSGIYNYAPIMVNDVLPNILYNRVKSMIFTSATLSLRNSFKFFVSNMGLDKLGTNTSDVEVKTNKVVSEKVVPSPFDYDKQTLVINTSFLPDTSDPFFFPQSKELIKTIVETNKVGSLVLFTSYKDLKAMYDGLEQSCYENDILLLGQGMSGGRTAMLNQFIEDGKAVLLGTSSFWEGVDVQGESLSLLILYKLPFQVPTEPIVEAYTEKLEKEGKRAFMFYSLPNALLKMRQGIGRLIRSKTDKGVILILDNRISTKEYGKYFKEIIPTRIMSATNPIETVDAVAKKLKNK